MKILVDMSNIKTGGSLQCGLSFLKMAHNDKIHQWYVAVSAELGEQIPKNWVSDFSDFLTFPKQNTIQKLYSIKMIMHSFEHKNQPDLVFSLFGPAFWRPKNVHITGFAIPHFLYPDMDIYRNEHGLVHKIFRLIISTKRKLKKFSFCRSDFLVVETAVVKQRCAQRLNFPYDRIFVVQNSFSQIFKDNVSKEKLKFDSNNRHQLFTLFIPSAWYRHKNLEIIPSIASVLKYNGITNFIFRFTLPSNSKAWSKIKALSAKLSVEAHIETAGKVPHAKLAKEYMGSNAVFLPTLLECSSSVYPEAMIAGIPIITSDLDFAHDACGNAALYFDPFDHEMASVQIIKLMNDEHLKQSLISQGYIELKKRFPTPEQKYIQQISMLQQAYNSRNFCNLQ